MANEQMHPTHQRPPSAETLAARDEEDRAAYHEAQRAGRFDDDDDAMALVADITEPVDARPLLKTWRCWIGEVEPEDLPRGADGPMREQVERTYRELTGHAPDFIFSGWGGVLAEYYRAVHEDREPDIEAQLAELRPIHEMLVDEAHRQGKCEHPIDRIDWIRRNVGREGPPESWQVNDFVALATVKLGDAVVTLNEHKPGRGLRHDNRDMGREALLGAIAVLLDCWERYEHA